MKLYMKVDWNFTHLYVDDKAWKKEYDILSRKIQNLELLFYSFLDNEQNFSNYLNHKIEIDLLIERVYCYPKRHLDIDSKLGQYKQMLEDALNLYSVIQKQNNYFENKIIQNNKLVKKYLKDKNLSHYRRYIELILRRKEHIPNTSTSDYATRLNTIRQSYQSLFSNTIKFENVMIDGQKKVVDRNNYPDLMIDKKQENRKKVYDTYTNSYALVSNLLSDIYISKLKQDIQLSKQEKYETLLSKKLYELELPNQILDKLIQKINKNLWVMHQYTKLKKDILGLKEYHVYDSSVSICNIPKIEYPLEESIKIIKSALRILGEDYIKQIDKMFDEGWVDVYPKNNKRTMSFTCISYVGVPYILINYNHSIHSIRTLAHEIGHAIHTWYSKINNPFEYFEFSYFFTEIASKVNEILVNEYMIKHTTNKEEKIYIMNNIISNLGNSLFGQVMLTEFEHSVINELSKGTNISSEYLNQLYKDLSKKYNGEDITYDDNIKYGWCKVPHLVMQDTYYLYQYSIGTALATDIAYRILNNEPDMTTKYKKFLTFGNRISIRQALQYLNIDLENGKYIEHAIKVLHKKIEDFRIMFNK